MAVDALPYLRFSFIVQRIPGASEVRYETNTAMINMCNFNVIFSVGLSK